MNSMTMQLLTHHTTAHLPDVRPEVGGEEEEEGEEVGVIMSVGPRVQDGQGVKEIMVSQCRTSDITLANNPTPHLPAEPQMGRINQKNTEKPT